jgi:hypothetical protein
MNQDTRFGFIMFGIFLMGLVVILFLMKLDHERIDKRLHDLEQREDRICHEMHLVCAELSP